MSSRWHRGKFAIPSVDQGFWAGGLAHQIPSRSGGIPCIGLCLRKAVAGLTRRSPPVRLFGQFGVVGGVAGGPGGLVQGDQYVGWLAAAGDVLAVVLLLGEERFSGPVFQGQLVVGHGGPGAVGDADAGRRDVLWLLCYVRVWHLITNRLRVQFRRLPVGCRLSGV